MKSFAIKQIMVPLSDYATVYEDNTMLEAIDALERIQSRFDPERYRHRAILVMDRQGRVIGKIGQLDILQAMEPKYEEIWDRNIPSHSGLTLEFMKSMLSNYELFRRPAEAICRSVGLLAAGDVMKQHSEGELIESDATLDEAIHRLVMGRYQSLLVTEKNVIVGILRLTDVVSHVSGMIKRCAAEE